MTSSQNSSNSQPNKPTKPAKGAEAPQSIVLSPTLSPVQVIINTAVFVEALAEPTVSPNVLQGCLELIYKPGSERIKPSDFPVLTNAESVRWLNNVAVGACVASFGTPASMTMETFLEMLEKLGFNFKKEYSASDWSREQQVALAVAYFIRSTPVEIAKIIQGIPQLHQQIKPPAATV